jgi:hypothetical protein
MSKVLKSLVDRWIISKMADKFNARHFGALQRRSSSSSSLNLIDITQTHGIKH